MFVKINSTIKNHKTFPHNESETVAIALLIKLWDLYIDLRCQVKLIKPQCLIILLFRNNSDSQVYQQTESIRLSNLLKTRRVIKNDTHRFGGGLWNITFLVIVCKLCYCDYFWSVTLQITKLGGYPRGRGGFFNENASRYSAIVPTIHFNLLINISGTTLTANICSKLINACETVSR